MNEVQTTFDAVIERQDAQLPRTADGSHRGSYCGVADESVVMGRQVMAEPDDDGGTNIWASDPMRSYPRQRAEGSDEPVSASARALLEGWPAQPGWVPDGGLGPAWGETPAQPAQYAAPQGAVPPPAGPAAYAPTPPGAWQPEQPYPATNAVGTGPQLAPGYPPGGAPTPAPYPGPRRRSPARTTA